MPISLTKISPRSGSIPTAYLSMNAVDRRHQSRGIGSILLADALKRAIVVADQIGLKAVVLDVIEDDGPDITEKRREFYARAGFLKLPENPMRMFISIATIRDS